MPSLERLYQTYKAKGLEVIAVSVDSSISNKELSEFKDKHGLSFKVLKSLDDELDSKFGISGVPETYFLDKDGRFLRFNDIQNGQKEEVIRVIGERPWDAPVYLKQLGEMLNDS